MNNKKRSKNPPVNNGKEINNAIPNMVFRPFKLSRVAITILGILSSLLCVFILLKIISGELRFSATQLNEISNFTLNVVLVIGALGLTIFLLPIKSNQPEKEKILIRYVGSVLVSTSVTILGYIVSHCDFFGVEIISYYCVAMLLVLSGSLIHTVSTMVAYFNIRD